MNVVRSMLPQNLPRTSPASQPRVGSEPGYVLVPGKGGILKGVSSPSQASLPLVRAASKGANPDRGTDIGAVPVKRVCFDTDGSKDEKSGDSRPPRPESPKCREPAVPAPECPDVVVITDEEKACRELLMATRFKGVTGYSSNTTRHNYTVVGATITPTPSYFELNAIPQTTVLPITNDERAGLVIKMERLKARIVFNMVWSTTSTVYSQIPMIRFWIYREKIPLVAGSAPNVVMTDANPPASGTAVYTCLGQTRTNGFNSMVAVKNPITEHLYHVYHDQVIKFDPSASNFSSSITVGSFGPKSRVIDLDIDLHGTQVDFSGPTSTSMITNALWLGFCSADNTSQGWVCGTTANFDLVYADGTEL